uniref:G protein pathway suppressor 2 n=1 Tax=Catagonus wagneri TaxID=51154 RepID=A0A8C3YGE4_9CETA
MALWPLFSRHNDRARYPRHQPVMMKQECKWQEEEEVDKIMEKKMKDAQERTGKKETEQILKLQEKLSLKKVLHEEEKRRRKEWGDLTALTSGAYQQGLTVHTGTHLLSMQGSPGGPSRPGTPWQLTEPNRCSDSKRLQAGTRWAQQLLSQGPQSTAIRRQPQQHLWDCSALASLWTQQPAYSPRQQLRAPSAFPAMQFLSQPQLYAGHSHLQPTKTGFLQPGGALSLPKQTKHAHQQTGFSDSSSLRPMHPQALPPAPVLPASPKPPVQMPPAGKSGFATTSQPAPQLSFIQHGQNPQLYHK